MKRVLLFTALIAVVASGCITGDGQLRGVQPRPEWVEFDPYGMNYIHFGSYTMGPSDQDVPYALNATARTVTIPAFYIDQHEISNNEYRQFVNYVRDSLFLDALAQDDNEVYFYAEDDNGRDMGDFIDKGYILNWEEEVDWEDEDIFDLLYNDFYLSQSEMFNNKRELDSRKLIYRYDWVDLQSAAKKSTRVEIGTVNDLDELHSIKVHDDRSQFVIEEQMPVYPDTLVWVHDFTYGYNEPLAESYFWHPAFDDYPVVGITWGQAKAFTYWRTNILNDWFIKGGQVTAQRFRMPSEAEWEYAARGGLDLSPFPWGGPYIRNPQGCPLANFKPMRGDYVDDNGCYTVPIGSYSPNDYGLYCMAGNVAEWTNTAYDVSVYEFAHDMSPEYQYNAKKDEPPAMKRKVVRGGSWKDIGYFCQVGSRSYEYQDTAKAYIGFRCAMSYPGRGKSGDPSTFNGLE